ncbi:DUF6338 family protein [Streptomyces sp. SBT349]|uniref:DUF6338 family protein n=1 Tax=Streptomyces sp. SBT349 TaxID=1580539 RepID=UPI00066BE977|nr:DUF6338 family protein [Streptomyces sp. SBT349]
MQTPSTIEQLVLLILLVLPGMTYQYLRERWRGPVAGERQLADRVLRAITASVALDAVYAVTVGPHLVARFDDPGTPLARQLLAEPRAVGLWALGLFIGVPAALAAAVSWRLRRGAATTYRAVPTAWDYAFGNRRDSRPCFLRARLKDGTWVGGWLGPRSYVSGYPESPDVFLQWAYEMGPDGSFGPPVTGTAGLYLRIENTDLLELVDPPPDPARRPHDD